KCQQSEDGFPVPSGSQVRKPPVEPFAGVATADSDDDDDTAPMDSQPYELHGSPRDSQ
ncbi:hypothetical protein Tco_1396800, partial [Tanacetum coccineum]